MRTKGHSFRYEWLTYVGGSMKTESSKQYIGMYGEGFKMCMLCLLCDFELKPRRSLQESKKVMCSGGEAGYCIPESEESIW